MRVFSSSAKAVNSSRIPGELALASHPVAAPARTKTGAASIPVSGHQYRPDIDGIRALAVVAVLIVHAFPDVLPGGFAGVDLFFVISGYLITGILAQEHAAGRFSLKRFYGRRVRRIFPSLALVLAASYGIGWFMMYAKEYQLLGKHIWAGAGFASNLVFLSEAGYFDRSAETKPLLHLWSLAIEEQFYMLWPPVLGLALRWRRAAAPVCAAVLLLSFGANAWLVREHAAAAFFLPVTRFWELLAGALLALAPAARPRSARQADLLSIAGLALALAACAVLRPAFAFPGWWALVPVLAACALVTAGPQGWVNRTLLATPLAVWLGRISYPLYLWHWPLLSFAWIVAGAQPVPASVRLGLVGISVLLAWLTTVGLEARFRYGPPRAAKLLVPCLALFTIGFVGNRVYVRDGFSFRKGYDAHADVSTASLGAGKEFTSKTCGVADRQLVPYCATDRRAAPRFAVWGDSKADALYWGLVRRSVPGQSWMLMGRSSCSPMSGVERTSLYNGDPPQDCARANRSILRALIANPALHTVVLAFSDRDTLGPHFAYSAGAPGAIAAAGVPVDDTTLALDGLDGAVTALERAGKRTALVLDNPRLPDPPRCMERAVLALPGVRDALGLGEGPAAARCDLPYGQYLTQRAALVEMVARLKRRHPALLVYDPAPVLCDVRRQVCPMTSNGKYLYSYGDHVSDVSNGRIADGLLPLL